MVLRTAILGVLGLALAAAFYAAWGDGPDPHRDPLRTIHVWHVPFHTRVGDMLTVNEPCKAWMMPPPDWQEFGCGHWVHIQQPRDPVQYEFKFYQPRMLGMK